MANKYTTLVKNTIWTMVGNSGSKILGFLLLPFYTHWLGTGGFGLSDLITTYATLLLGISTLCIAESIFVFTKGDSDESRKVNITSSFVLSLLLLFICLVFFIIADLISGNIGISNSFFENLWLIYLMILSTFFQQYFHNLLLGLGFVKLFSYTGFILSITTFLFSYMLIPLWGVKGYILSSIFSNIITMTYCVIVSKSYHYFDLKKVNRLAVKRMLQYSVPLIPNSIVWWLVSALNRPVMAHYLSYDEIGIYSLANRFPSVITMLFAIFSTSWNISIFEEYQKEGFVKFYKDVFKTVFILLTICGILVIVFSHSIIKIFASKEFIDAALYMPILTIATFMACLSSFWGGIFSVVKQSIYFFYSSILGALAAILLNFILIPKLNLWGTVSSVFISFAIIAFSRYHFSQIFVNSGLLKSSVFYVLILMFVALFSIRWAGSFVAYLVGAGSIMFLLFIERTMLRNIILALIRKL